MITFGRWPKHARSLQVAPILAGSTREAVGHVGHTEAVFHAVDIPSKILRRSLMTLVESRSAVIIRYRPLTFGKVLVGMKIIRASQTSERDVSLFHLSERPIVDIDVEDDLPGVCFLSGLPRGLGPALPDGLLKFPVLMGVVNLAVMSRYDWTKGVCKPETPLELRKIPCSFPC